MPDLKLKTYEDYYQILKKILEPTKKYFNNELSGIELPNYYATSYSDAILRFESFSRLLWGAMYLNNEDMDYQIVFSMIENGVNPRSQEYWGKLSDYGQMIVETLPILLYCVKKKEHFNCLNENTKSQIGKWFYQINNVKVSENNWEFFVILDNALLEKLGLDYSVDSINEAFNKIDEMYLGNGWYSDGKNAQRDYYISFGMHFYSLLYYILSSDIERNKIIKERAIAFSKTFMSWFSEDGGGLPFGRSLTYKFAQSAFWAGMIISGIDIEHNGIYKGLLNRNLRWWFSQNIFFENGLISIGYAYPNQAFSEYYNGAGSSYWCLKAFSVLWLSKHNIFFSIEEEKFPADIGNVSIAEAMMDVKRYNGDVYAFVNGQRTINMFGHTEAKYEKFVYSTLFGFSTSKSYLGLEQLAADNNLAISFNGIDFIQRHICEDYYSKDGIQYSLWKPLNGVAIKCAIIPSVPSHIRAYFIHSDFQMIFVDHGFAVRREGSTSLCSGGSAVVSTNGQFSEIISLYGNGEPVVINSAPNTNILHPRTLIPAIRWELNPGDYIVCNEVVGNRAFSEIAKHTILVKGNKLLIDGIIVDFTFKKVKQPYMMVGIMKKFKALIKRLKNSI